jgi:selenoprotein W-related protein
VEVEIAPGPTGKFIVEVDGQAVAEKGILGFPSEEEIVAAVRKKIQPA